MTTEQKLAKLIELADECRRVQKTSRRPPNAFEQRALAATERALDTLLTELQTEVLLSPVIPSPATT